MTAAPGLREIQAGELAVILPRSAVVGLRRLYFVGEDAEMYSLFLEHYPGNPSLLILVPANSFIF